MIAPTEVHRDFTSDVHVRLHFGHEFIRIRCFCKIAYCPNFIAVRCIIREIFDTRSDRRSHPRPGDEVYEASGAAMQVPPPVKACLEGGLVNAEPARVGS